MTFVSDNAVTLRAANQTLLRLFMQVMHGNSIADACELLLIIGIFLTLGHSRD